MQLHPAHLSRPSYKTKVNCSSGVWTCTCIRWRHWHLQSLVSDMQRPPLPTPTYKTKHVSCIGCVGIWLQSRATIAVASLVSDIYATPPPCCSLTKPKKSSSSRVCRHVVADKVNTCSCKPIVGHKTSPSRAAHLPKKFSCSRGCRHAISKKKNTVSFGSIVMQLQNLQTLGVE